MVIIDFAVCQSIATASSSESSHHFHHGDHRLRCVPKYCHGIIIRIITSYSSLASLTSPYAKVLPEHHHQNHHIIFIIAISDFTVCQSLTRASSSKSSHHIHHGHQ
ncbi:unnamed protein product [Rotaria socialis]